MKFRLEADRRKKLYAAKANSIKYSCDFRNLRTEDCFVDRYRSKMYIK